MTELPEPDPRPVRHGHLWPCPGFWEIKTNCVCDLFEDIPYYEDAELRKLEARSHRGRLQAQLQDAAPLQFRDVELDELRSWGDEPIASRAERFARWRLNAPEGFNWTDADVLHEKNGSLLNGMIIGWSAAVILTLILGMIL